MFANQRISKWIKIRSINKEYQTQTNIMPINKEELKLPVIAPTDKEEVKPTIIAPVIQEIKPTIIAPVIQEIKPTIIAPVIQEIKPVIIVPVSQEDLNFAFDSFINQGNTKSADIVSANQENGIKRITLVSAFITNINKSTERSIFDYINYGKQLLAIKLPKIIFIEQEIHNKYYRHMDDEYTKFIFIKKTDLYFYEYMDLLKNSVLDTCKNTLEYCFVQCHKTEWVKQAIELNFFNTNQFAWLDFGIYHIVKNPAVFQKAVYKMNDREYKNVRIGGIVGLNNISSWDIYRHIAWYFAGGVFGGDKESLLKFADLMKKKCISIINEKNHLMWEVNVWYLIAVDNKDLFNIYGCNHNPSIIEHY